MLAYLCRGHDVPFIDGVVGRYFSTGQKAVTSRWPTGTRAGAEFKLPTMGRIPACQHGARDWQKIAARWFWSRGKKAASTAEDAIRLATSYRIDPGEPVPLEARPEVRQVTLVV
jgi:hypothetical protein